MDAAARYLLVGNSVRYLAQSAHAATTAVVAVDAFADVDTRAASVFHERISSCTAHALSRAAAAVTGDCSGWIYGAGFEDDPGALSWLARRRPGMLGNDPSVLHWLAQPRRRFALLEELGIAYPEVMFESPPAPAAWLAKPPGGCGGSAVRRASDPVATGPAGYFQRYVNGPLCSLTFAADGAAIMGIGFNRLMARYPAAGDFRFAGAIGGLQPSPAVRERMLETARRLTRALGLRGVNGLDFVLQRGEPLLLDLNARPPASLELYETILPRGGCLTHVDACRGRLPAQPGSDVVRGLRIVYARRPITVRCVEWPSWVSDCPVPGSSIPAEAPLCTVHAEGRTIEAVAGQLRQHTDSVLRLAGSVHEQAA